MDYVNSYPDDCVFMICLNRDWILALATGSCYHTKADTIEFLTLHPDAEAYSCNYPWAPNGALGSFIHISRLKTYRDRTKEFILATSLLLEDTWRCIYNLNQLEFIYERI